MSPAQDWIAHYEAADERERLTVAPGGRLELIRTQELLARFLPPSPAVILDVGGAAGIHAAPLAAGGYEVHLVDPVRRHVEQAGEVPELASVRSGDARSLDRPDDSVDAVLLLGPLYHLTERADRVAALAEARRVLRPGGVIAAAVISRYASTLDGLFRGYLRAEGFESLVARDVAEGQHRNPDDVPGWFTTAYFHEPDEVPAEALDAGLDVEALIAIEGPAWLVPDLRRCGRGPRAAAAHHPPRRDRATPPRHEPASAPRGKETHHSSLGSARAVSPEGRVGSRRAEGDSRRTTRHALIGVPSASPGLAGHQRGWPR